MSASDLGHADFIISREVDGETLVLDEGGHLIHRLNPTASLIWRRARGGATAEAIASELLGAYEVEPEAASRDVATTLARLAELNLIATAEGLPRRPHMGVAA